MTEQPSDQPISPTTPPIEPPTSTPTATTGSEPVAWETAETSQVKLPPIPPPSVLQSTPTATTGSEPAALETAETPQVKLPPIPPPSVLQSDLDANYLPLIRKDAVPPGCGVHVAAHYPDGERMKTLLDLPNTYGQLNEPMVREWRASYKRDPLRFLKQLLDTSDDKDWLYANLLVHLRGGPDGKPKYELNGDKIARAYTGPGSRRVMGAFEDSFRDKFIDPTKEWLKDEMKPYEKEGKLQTNTRAPLMGPADADGVIEMQQ